MLNKLIITIVLLSVITLNIHAITEGDVGFLNVINGTGKSVALSVNGNEINPSFEHGGMTGGMVVPAGIIKISSKIEGLKDKSEPLKIEKNKSNLAVILIETTEADPTEEIIKIEPIDYKIRDVAGYSAGLIYVGSNTNRIVSTKSGRVYLKKYKYQDMGNVSSIFTFSSDDGTSFTGEFQEPLHYTLVLLDGSKNGKSNVVVVPHVVFAKPTFN